MTRTGLPDARLLHALGGLGGTVLAVWGAVALALGPLESLLLHVGRGEGRATSVPLEIWVTGAAGAVLIGAALWISLVALACVHELVTGAVPVALVGRLAPAAVRRVVLLGCGVAVGTAGLVGPAAAADPAPARPPAVPHALAGLPVPDRAVGPALRPPVRPALPSVVVGPGDSLWSLAQAMLPPDSSNRDVDACWRRLHRLNEEVVGNDPDLLLPGTTLQIPARHRPCE